MILALFLGSRIGYTLKTYEPREAGVTRNGSIYSHPVLQYQEGREEDKDGSNLLVQHRVRKGVGELSAQCMIFKSNVKLCSIRCSFQSESAGRPTKRPTYNGLAGKPE
ncbi:unnamed protein product [Porites lobata]|uniref:Uncharacterized protein n=1 Tax=Porites lobata TaxID=104759 RepID=A0ABN8NAY1_9CNID|nr:unnamed protein product [Porites lobata]